MRYLILLITIVSCSQSSEPTYTPNPQAVELNNQASELVFNLPMFDTTDRSSTYHQALELLDSALNIDNQNSVIYGNKHQALIKLGRLEQAASSLKMATENINNFAEGYVGIAFIYEYLNNKSTATLNYKKAINEYEIRNKKSNKQERIHNNCEIAFVTMCLNNQQLAAEQMNDLLEDYPNNEEVKMYKGLISTFDKKKFINERFARL